MGCISFILTISLYFVISCYLEERDSNGDSLGPIDAGEQYFVCFKLFLQVMLSTSTFLFDTNYLAISDDSYLVLIMMVK